MNRLAEVNGELRGEVSIADVQGEIDASNVAEVGTLLRALVANRSFGLIVDLTATTYLDSAGINLLFALGDELRARQQRLQLVVGPRTPIARMLAVTGLDAAYPAHASVEDAVAAA
jgi:anti-anti-sigma factor